MSIYKKPPLKKDLRKTRYDAVPQQPSKHSNYVEYSMEDNEFIEEKQSKKPIFSG